MYSVRFLCPLSYLVADHQGRLYPNIENLLDVLGYMPKLKVSAINNVKWAFLLSRLNDEATTNLSLNAYGEFVHILFCLNN